MSIGSAASAGAGSLKFLRPRTRLQSTDITAAAAAWSVSAGAAALWLVQPFDWIKKQFFEKPKTEQ